MVMYREVCPEGVQNKCPGGVGFMSWGDTLILVISRGVQLYYGIAHCDMLFIILQFTVGCHDNLITFISLTPIEHG